MDVVQPCRTFRTVRNKNKIFQWIAVEGDTQGEISKFCLADSKIMVEEQELWRKLRDLFFNLLMSGMFYDSLANFLIVKISIRLLKILYLKI